MRAGANLAVRCAPLPPLRAPRKHVRLLPDPARRVQALPLQTVRRLLPRLRAQDMPRHRELTLRVPRLLRKESALRLPDVLPRRTLRPRRIPDAALVVALRHIADREGALRGGRAGHPARPTGPELRGDLRHARREPPVCERTPYNYQARARFSPGPMW